LVVYSLTRIDNDGRTESATNRELALVYAFVFIFNKCAYHLIFRFQLYNLLGNAVKFSRDEGTIELTVRVISSTENDQHVTTMNGFGGIGPTTIRFDVKDYGKGIEATDFSKIFEPFRQATAETESVYGGTGLGLAISSKLANALGGEISVDSVVDEWSQFMVEFPLKDPVADVDAISTSLQGVHTLLLCTDSELLDHLTNIFKTCHAKFSVHPSLDSVESLVQNGTVPSAKRFVFVVDEKLFARDIYHRIRGKIGTCTLYTFGPEFSVKEDDNEDNFRNISQMFPSVLMGKLSQEAIQSNGTGGANHVPRRRSSQFDKPRESLSSIRVLIAEDNAINQKVLIRLLKRLQVENISVAEDGQQAVDMEATGGGFDIILMDYQMPIMNGVEACQQILGRERNAAVEATPKVVFLTAHASSAFEKECYDAGGDGFLPKPFDIKGIQECLETILFQSSSSMLVF
jgi:two-component system sensor histidine kinase/response regulator